MEAPAFRFHVELNSIKVDSMNCKFNIFGDNLSQVTADLEKVIDYVTGGGAPLTVPPAQPSAQAGPQTAASTSIPPKVPPAGVPAPKPKPAAPPPQKVGSCVTCNSENLEWVTGNRKDNRKEFAAFKCQECGKWQPEAKS